MKAIFGLVVEYSGKGNYADELIERAVGVEAWASGYDFGEHRRDMAFDFRTKKAAEAAATRVRQLSFGPSARVQKRSPPPT